MTARLQFFLLSALGVYFILIFYLLTKKRINLKYTLRICTEFVGVETPMNGLFAMLIFAVLVILMSLTAIVSKLNEKSKRIIQALALLEKRVRELEGKDGKGT